MQTTTQFLDNLQDRTEAILQKATQRWQMLPLDELTTPPAPGAWSAAQCWEHLNLYGRYYLPALESAIARAERQGAKPAKTVKPGWLGAWFTDLMLPTAQGGLKRKLQAPKMGIPSPTVDARVALAEFIAQQEKMLLLLRRAAAVNLNTLRIPTTLSPLLRLRMGDTFHFNVAHTERHVLQAERALRVVAASLLGV